MTTLPIDLKPVRLGKYRYSKLRWRVLAHALDFLGAILMRIVRRASVVPPAGPPRQILIVQLDHLGDAILTTPLIAQLRLAYPEAAIDVLASESNREVFEANPQLNRVHVAQRTWFERDPARWGLVPTVWRLGHSLRHYRYDLGIDVRGDVLSVLVLAFAGVPRRVGWSMGGGSFLLTDVAQWIPLRHEVHSRLALLAPLGIVPDEPARVDAHVSDWDRIVVARRLAEAWPRRTVRRAPAHAASVQRGRGGHHRAGRPSPLVHQQLADEPDWLHADRFAPQPPLLAVHMGAGTPAKRWPPVAWKDLIERFLEAGWRVVVVGGIDDLPLSSFLRPHERLRDWTATMTVQQTTALLERADLFVGADSGPAHLAASAGTLSVVLFSGTNRPRQWRPWSRHALVLRRRVPCQPCHQKVCPLAGHPCMAGLRPDRVYTSAMRWWSRTHRAESPHAPL
jgi:ADP-heptose:LPS heptosyltransferase